MNLMTPPTTTELIERLRQLGYDVTAEQPREELLEILVEHAMGWCVPIDSSAEAEANHPRPMPRAEKEKEMSVAIREVEVISLTPNGRELRREVKEDGTERFAVQPPRDNYWVTARTPRAALLRAGWPRRLVDEQYSGDWRTW